MLQAFLSPVFYFLHVLANENRMLITAFTASVTAQVIKFTVSSLRARTVLSERLFSSGGMPSAHSAMVTALATSVGATEGWHSNLFAIVAVFATIVLYDAIGIRFAVGQQARFLNDLVGRETDHLAFKEALGHTPSEVIAGAVLGVIVASLFFR